MISDMFADITWIESGGFSIGKTVALGVGFILVVGGGLFLILLANIAH